MEGRTNYCSIQIRVTFGDIVVHVETTSDLPSKAQLINSNFFLKISSNFILLAQNSANFAVIFQVSPYAV